MGKTCIQEQNSHQIKGNAPQIHRTNKRQASTRRSKKKCFQFFEILRDIQGLQGRNKGGQINEAALLDKVADRIMHFFNRQRVCSLELVNRYAICLANLLHLLGNRAGNLTFGKGFKVKIKKICSYLAHQKSSSQLTKQIMQAFFYILTVLIHQEKITKNPGLQEISHSIFSNKEFMRLLLSIQLIKDKKISKFYGFIMIHVSNQNRSRKMKEAITKATLLNLQKIQYQTTFFNLLTLLRGERNRTKISYQDVSDGNVTHILLQSYIRLADRQQSSEILEYLIHILLLFPAVASAVSQAKYIANLLNLPVLNSSSQSKIVTIIELFMKYGSSEQKTTIVESILNLIQTTRPKIVLKLTHIFAQNHIPEEKLIYLAQIGYFTDVLPGKNIQNEEYTIKQIIALKLVCAKILKINYNIGQYFNYQLVRKLKVMKEKVPKEWLTFHDHIDQYLM